MKMKTRHKTRKGNNNDKSYHNVELVKLSMQYKNARNYPRDRLHQFWKRADARSMAPVIVFIRFQCVQPHARSQIGKDENEKEAQTPLKPEFPDMVS